MPGELVMTILDDDTGYPNFALDYSYTDTPTTELFWTQHNNTYEIP